MKRKDDNNAGIYLGLGLFVLFIIVGFYTGWRDYRKYDRFYNQGEIIQAEIIELEHSDEDSPRTITGAIYTYHIDDIAYTGHDTFQSNDGEALRSNLEIGQKRDIYYLPDEPSQSILVENNPAYPKTFMVSFIMMILMVFVSVILYLAEHPESRYKPYLVITFLLLLCILPAPIIALILAFLPYLLVFASLLFVCVFIIALWSGLHHRSRLNAMNEELLCESHIYIEKHKFQPLKADISHIKDYLQEKKFRYLGDVEYVYPSGKTEVTQWWYHHRGIAEINPNPDLAIYPQTSERIKEWLRRAAKDMASVRFITWIGQNYAIETHFPKGRYLKAPTLYRKFDDNLDGAYNKHFIRFGSQQSTDPPLPNSLEELLHLQQTYRDNVLVTLYQKLRFLRWVNVLFAVGLVVWAGGIMVAAAFLHGLIAVFYIYGLTAFLAGIHLYTEWLKLHWEISE